MEKSSIERMSDVSGIDPDPISVLSMGSILKRMWMPRIVANIMNDGAILSKDIRKSIKLAKYRRTMEWNKRRTNRRNCDMFKRRYASEMIGNSFSQKSLASKHILEEV